MESLAGEQSRNPGPDESMTVVQLCCWLDGQGQLTLVCRGLLNHQSIIAPLGLSSFDKVWLVSGAPTKTCYMLSFACNGLIKQGKVSPLIT